MIVRAAPLALVLALALSACGLERMCVDIGAGCPAGYSLEDDDED